MHRVHVYYDRWPELADKLREHADPDSTDAYASMPKRRWLAIRDGKPIPGAKARETKPKGVGLGDVVEAAAKITGADKLAKAYEKATGKGCGCAGRKEKLNKVRVW